MGEIRIVGPGKTRGYPYPVCKNTEILDMQTWASKQRCGQQPAGKKHHLPIIIHSPYLCISGINQ